MSEYFRKERFNRDKDRFAEFIVYIFILVLALFWFSSLLNVAKSRIETANKNCVSNGYSLTYCKLISR